MGGWRAGRKGKKSVETRTITTPGTDVFHALKWVLMCMPSTQTISEIDLFCSSKLQRKHPRPIPTQGKWVSGFVTRPRHHHWLIPGLLGHHRLKREMRYDLIDARCFMIRHPQSVAVRDKNASIFQVDAVRSEKRVCTITCVIN